MVNYGVDIKWLLPYLDRNDVYMLRSKSICRKDEKRQWEPIPEDVSLDEVDAVAIYSGYSELKRLRRPGYEKRGIFWQWSDISQRSDDECDMLVLDLVYRGEAYYAKARKDENGRLILQEVRKAFLNELANEMMTMQFPRQEDKLLSYLMFVCTRKHSMSDWVNAWHQAAVSNCTYHEKMRTGVCEDESA